MKKKYVNLSKHIKYCRDNSITYFLAIGKRSNGKSYSTKNELCEYCYKNGVELAYIRRWREDMKALYINDYFTNVQVSKITKGKYDCIDYFRGVIYWGKIMEDGKIERGQILGRTFALNEAVRYKSLEFPQIVSALFEEVMPDDNRYLSNEPQLLESLISTIFRDRKPHVIMIANSISRICPYFTYWSMRGIYQQKQESLELYNIGEETKLLVYYMGDNGHNNAIFSTKNKMSTSGEWVSEIYPCISAMDFKRSEKLYTIVFEYNDFMFLMNLINLDNNIMFHVERKTTHIKENTRVVSNKFYPSRLCTNSFKPLFKFENQVFSYLDKIVFTDNLTGTEFYQCAKIMRAINIIK